MRKRVPVALRVSAGTFVTTFFTSPAAHAAGYQDRSCHLELRDTSRVRNYALYGPRNAPISSCRARASRSPISISRLM